MKRFNQAVAILLASTLVLTAPGLFSYRVLAEVVNAAGSVGQGIVPGISGAGVVPGALGSDPAHLLPSSVVQDAGLKSSLTGVESAPHVQTGLGGTVESAAREGSRQPFQGLRHAQKDAGFASPSAMKEESVQAQVEGAPESATAEGTQGLNVFQLSEGNAGLVAQPASFILASVQISKLPAAGAHQAGYAVMDRILGALGVKSGKGMPDYPPIQVPEGSEMNPVVDGLGNRPNFQNQGGVDSVDQEPSRDSPGESSVPRVVSQVRGLPPEAILPAFSPQGNRPSKIAAFLGTVAKVAAGAGAVYGLQVAAATLLPAVFGLVPVAAVWAVSSGLLLLPVALYARYRLSRSDSPRLGPVKRFVDLALGAVVGASIFAAPALLVGSFAAQLALAVPLAAAASFSLGRFAAPGVGGALDMGLTYGSLAFLPQFFVAASAAGPLGLAPILGMMALPALTTVSFFLGRIRHSAEKGRAFRIPGGLQAIRFPAYTWVMTGVVFALLTGFAPVYVNYAFALWMFMGSSKLFNYAFLGTLALTAATGFASPLTFLVLAFAPERAALWTEKLLGRWLKEAQPAPSSVQEEEDEEAAPQGRKPNFHYGLKTIFGFAGLVGLGTFMAATVFGFGSLLVNTGIAAGMSLLSYILSDWMVIKLFKLEPVSRESNPKLYGMLEELVELENRNRVGQGKRPRKMPRLYRMPMDAPNAFATGRTPNSSLVAVTDGLLAITLDSGAPQAIRARLGRMIGHPELPPTVLKIAGRTLGLPPEASREETARALQEATEARLADIGARMLKGILAHELHHAWNWDIAIRTVAGALTSGISYASYGVLWAVGHAKILLTKLWEKVAGKPSAAEPKLSGKPQGPPSGTSPRTAVPRDVSGAPSAQASSESSETQPQVLPIGAAAGVKAVPVLVKVFASLFAPIFAQLILMGISRTREGDADVDGASLTKDAAASALGLAFIAGWGWDPIAAAPRGWRGAVQHAAVANGSIFTVSPTEQMGGPQAVTGRWSQRLMGDDFLFELFLSHPNTLQRIRRLWKVAEAQPSGSSGPAVPRSPGNLERAAEGEEAAEEEGDIGTYDSALEPELRPGLDDRLLPVVNVLKAEIESNPAKFQKLGHLLGTFHEILNTGGRIRYASISVGMAPLNSFYEVASRTLFLHMFNKRSPLKLQAAHLAAQLQQVYDLLNSRGQVSQEAAVRQILAFEAFLEGTEMTEFAKDLDISNPVNVEFFEEAVQKRLMAAFGLSALEQVFGQLPTTAQMFQKAKDQLALLQKQLHDLKDQLGLVEGALAPGEPKDSRADLERQKRVLGEKIKILSGGVYLLNAQIALIAKELDRPGGGTHPLETPLSVAETRTPLNLDAVVIVQAKKFPKMDPGLAGVIELLKQTIERSSDPETQNLSYIVVALSKLLASGGRVYYASSGEGAAAFFSPVTLDLVVGQHFKNAHPALVAAILVHELTHAADYFGVPRPGETAWEPRPMTRETEKNAFTNEAIFAGNFDPEEIARKLDVRNPMEYAAYHLIFHARQRYVEGDKSLESMISHAYTQLFGAHFEGLQTAEQVLVEFRKQKLEPLVEAHKNLKQRAELVERAARSGQAQRQAQLQMMLRALKLQEALITVYKRIETQLESAAKDSSEPAPAVRSGERPVKDPESLPPGLFGPSSFLGPKISRARASIGMEGRSLVPPGSFSLHASRAPPEPLLDPPEPGGRRPAGLARKALESLTSPLRVLPRRDQNKTFWKFVFGKVLLALGQAFHYVALPGLLGSTERVAYVRGANWTAHALSSISTAPPVDRAALAGRLGRLQALNTLARAVPLIAVVLLFFNGVVLSGPGIFALAVAVSVFFVQGFVQAMGLTADSVTLIQIVGKGEGHYNKANAWKNFAESAASFIGFLTAGAFIGAMDAHLGASSGNAMAYAVYGALAVAAGLFFAAFLRIPKPSREEVVAAAPRQGWWRELNEGRKLFWGNRFLKLSFLFTALDLLVADALLFLVLPKYIKEVLGPAATLSTSLGHLPVVGWFLELLTTQSGNFGIYLAAGVAGGAAASILLGMGWLAGKLRAAQAGSLSDLERQGRFTNFLYAAGALAFVGVLVGSSLPLSVLAFSLFTFLQTPANVVWTSLYQKVVGEKYPKDMGKVYGAIFFFQLLLQIVGTIGLGILLANVSVWAGLTFAAVAMAIVAALHIVEPYVVFPINRPPAPSGANK